MSYKSRNKHHTSATNAYDGFCTFMTDIGWTLHDTVTSTNKIFKSQGEDGNFAPAYARLYLSGNRLYHQSYLYWNASTHVGTCKSYTQYGYPYVDTTNWETYLYGSKDLVFIGTKYDTSTGYNSFSWFGFIPKQIDNVQTTLSASATSGDNATLTVVATSDFKEGLNYQIIGNNYEGVDWLTINSITDATHMVVSNLPRNYSSGSYIGINPCPFGHGLYSPAGIMYLVASREKSGTGTGLSSQYASLSSHIFNIGSYAHSDPDTRTSRYILVPLFWNEKISSNISDSISGYCSENFYKSPFYTYTGNNYDLFIIQKRDNGTASSGASTTLTDSTKTWTVDGWSNKYVAIVGGTGDGQVRKISSNTATVLTVSIAWKTDPDGTSVYQIADEVYRKLNYFALKEEPS